MRWWEWEWEWERDAWDQGPARVRVRININIKVDVLRMMHREDNVRCEMYNSSRYCDYDPNWRYKKKKFPTSPRSSLACTFQISTSARGVQDGFLAKMSAAFERRLCHAMPCHAIPCQRRQMQAEGPEYTCHLFAPIYSPRDLGLRPLLYHFL